MSASDLDKARKLFEETDLGFPPIPASLANAFHEQEEGGKQYSSEKVEDHPYDYRNYLFRMRQPDVASFVTLAYGGHGVNSWAISYYLAYNELRLLFQLGWGDAYMDDVKARKNIRSTWAVLRDHWPALERRFSSPTGEGVCLFAWSDFWRGLELCAGDERKLTGEGRMETLADALTRFSQPKKEG